MTRPVILTLGALLAGCAAGAASKAPAPRASAEASSPTLLVAMQWQGRPSCQSYRLAIDTQGEVRFHSHCSMFMREPDVSQLPPDALVALRAAIARSGFAATAQNCCDNCVIFDGSPLTLTVADGAAPKTITDNECSEAPTTVRDLAQTVEGISGIERLIDRFERLIDPEEAQDLCSGE